MKLRLLSLFLLSCFVSMASAQEVAPPAPQRLDIHSKVLKEDRVIWVRTPPGYQLSKDAYPVVYQTDAPGHVNEIASTIDFLVNNSPMPPLIVARIPTTDPTPTLPPTHPDIPH